MDTSIRKYTAIWQSLKPKQVNRVQETFGDWISEHIFDNKHEVVLDNAILFDTFIYFRSRLLRAFSRKNAFLVHFQDETYAGQYQLYENFRGVSRNYWSSIFNPAIRAHNSAWLYRAFRVRCLQSKAPPRGNTSVFPRTDEQVFAARYGQIAAARSASSLLFDR